MFDLHVPYLALRLSGSILDVRAVIFVTVCLTVCCRGYLEQTSMIGCAAKLNMRVKNRRKISSGI